MPIRYCALILCEFTPIFTADTRFYCDVERCQRSVFGVFYPALQARCAGVFWTTSIFWIWGSSSARALSGQPDSGPGTRQQPRTLSTPKRSFSSPPVFPKTCRYT